MPLIRLDKYLADMQAGTRSQAKELIRSGRVRVDGSLTTRPEKKISTEDARVCVDGREVPYVLHEYYMLNKPAGVITASSDRRERTVADLVSSVRKDVFPVGRLDRDTEGLLILTNDGALAHRLLSPAHKVKKTYEATVEGRPGTEEIRAFREGLWIDEERNGTATEAGMLCRPAELVILSFDPVRNESLVRIVITEGKYHQVKRMVRAIGSQVRYLKRVAIGSLSLDGNLAPGEYRELTAEELRQLNIQIDRSGEA